ncbi:MAG: DUF1343 domain-containing protein [Verrucomicrobia bacterium]|nr:DUF1343 domain-containing protein [Verrucomicrobiota bacterium]
MVKLNLIHALLFALVCSFASNLPAQVQLGGEVLATNQFKPLIGKRVGLITNPSGVNRELQSTIDVLRRAPGVKLVALFGAEHGIRGEAGAGLALTNSIDARTGLPVFSLYGKTRKPTPAMLKGLDALVYDIQDTGCRAYTFISTMGLAMEACAEANVEFVVLDRPNPLGGERVEGPMVNPRFRSFVGRWDTPYVYGMTCGELARMINGERWIPKRCKLTVIPMKNWKRGMVWRDTGLTWIPTSPHVPTGDSPMFQVATGMIGEIGGVNIAMHTAAPFQCVAAPWLDAGNFCATLNRYRLPGVRFDPVAYASANGVNRLNGARIYFTDPHRAPLTAINFFVLEAVRSVNGRDLFVEATREGRNFVMFDKVNGTDATRRDLQVRRSAANIVKSWKPGEEAFRQKRKKYLLY